MAWLRPMVVKMPTRTRPKAGVVLIVLKSRGLRARFQLIGRQSCPPKQFRGLSLRDWSLQI